MDDFRIDNFDAKVHQRATFDCGNPALNHFLRTLATQYERRLLGRTCVAVRLAEPRVVVGYHTLAAGTIAYKSLPSDVARKLPRHSIPAILLGRLAVDLSAQGKGLGTALLVDAAQRALEISGILGAFAMEVLADDERAAAYYARFGFRSLLDGPQHMYLPLTTAKDAIDRARSSRPS
jgi:GNAT superfamily N-acetyltransferase